MPHNTKLAIGVSIAAVLVFAAAFLPWGEIRAAPQLRAPFGGDFPFPGGMFEGMQMTLTITGWNGNITLVGLKLPNWLVVLAAGGVTALCWLKASSVWDAPPAVSFVVAAYGLLHAGFALVVLILASEGSPGVGVILTGLAFIAILVILAQQVRSSERTSMVR